MDRGSLAIGLMDMKNLGKYGIILLVGIVPIFFFFSPIIFVIIKSFFIEGRFTFANYIKFFFSYAFVRCIWNSLLITTVSVSIIVPTGLVIVFFTVKNDLMRRIVKGLTSLSFVFPYYVFCIALIYIYGSAGILSGVFSNLGLDISGPNFLYSIRGVIFANIMFLLPYFIIPVFSSFENLDPNLDDVAESLGSYGFHKFRKVTFPQIFHGFVTAIMITSLILFNGISVILALGSGKIITLPYQIYSQYGRFQYGMANTVSTISIVMTLIIAAIFQIILKERK